MSDVQPAARVHTSPMTVWLAVRKGDEVHGMIYFHEGDDSGFVARKKGMSRPKLRKTKR